MSDETELLHGPLESRHRDRGATFAAFGGWLMPVNYTTVTLVTLLSLMVLIFVLNYAFAKGVLWLFNP